MYTNKAHLIAMNAQLTEQLAMVRVSGTLAKSTEVMTLVNNLVKVCQYLPCFRPGKQCCMLATGIYLLSHR